MSQRLLPFLSILIPYFIPRTIIDTSNVMLATFRYIRCDECRDWFHPSCVGLDDNMLEEFEGRWICQACEDAKLYCLCQKPYGENEFYLGCEGCEGWFHPSCCGISEEQVAKFKDIDDGGEGLQFFCPNCKRSQLNGSVPTSPSRPAAAPSVSSGSIASGDFRNPSATTPSRSSPAPSSILSPSSSGADPGQYVQAGSRLHIPRRKKPTVVVVPAPREEELFYYVAASRGNGNHSGAEIAASSEQERLFIAPIRISPNKRKSKNVETREKKSVASSSSSSSFASVPKKKPRLRRR